MEVAKIENNYIEKEELKKLLDNFKWSYSRVNSFVTCPYMFYKNYILKDRGEENCFAQFGIFMHGIMEKYDKGELALYELEDYYKENYSSNITIDFPPNKWVNLSESYYNSGLEYLSNFDGYDDKILGAEEKIDFEIENEKRKIVFTGVVDRISEDENGIVISDYKSKKKFKSKKEEKEYFRQMYVYSIAMMEKYGKLPYKLKFYLFRDFNNVCETLFDEKELENAKNWLFDTIEEIYNTEVFERNPNDFFCKHICLLCNEEESWY